MRAKTHQEFKRWAEDLFSTYKVTYKGVTRLLQAADSVDALQTVCREIGFDRNALADSTVIAL